MFLPLQAAILRCIIDSYRVAYEECSKGFEEPDLQMALPHYRWVKINAALRGIPPSLGVKPTAEPYHTLLDAGGVRMTASRVEETGQLPRLATFRETYAQTAQLNLYDDNPSPNEAAPLYGIITHGPAKNQRQPLFVDVGFPDMTCTQFVGDSIDLFRRFPDIAATLQELPEERVTAEPAVRPRRPRIASENL